MAKHKLHPAIGAAVVIAGAAAGFVMGWQSPANEAQASTISATTVGKLRTTYRVDGTSITEFALTDGTPCVMTGYREVVTCGWGYKWGETK